MGVELRVEGVQGVSKGGGFGVILSGCVAG